MEVPFSYALLLIQALGLSRLHQKVEHADTPQIRGMVEKVKHLVEVREQD